MEIGLTPQTGGTIMTFLREHALTRRTFLAGTAAAAALALPGIGFASDETTAPQRGGRLRVGINAGSAKDTLDAKAPLTDADLARQNNLYDTLLVFNPDYRIEPALAESVEPSERSTAWTIRLRKGVTFHNGKPLTAKDIVATFHYALDPKNPGASASRLHALDTSAFEILDDLTLKVRFKTPFSVFREVIADLGTGGLRVIPEGYDPANPVGTGPFKAQEFAPGMRSLFVANKNYWREGEPYVDELEIINFTDDSARVNALLSGQIDALANLPSNQVRLIEAQPQFKIIKSETGAWNPFTMRVDAKPFDDLRVRKAFRLLVNRQQLVDQVLAGEGVVANDLFARYDPGYAAVLSQREVDIDQAKSLLKQAGQEGLAAEIVTSPVSTGLVQSAEALVQQATLAGVSLTLRQVEPSTFFAQYFLKSPLSQTYWGTRNYLLQTADSMLPNAPYNETHWKNDAWLKLVQEGFAEPDDARRGELIAAAQAIEHEEGGYINWGWYNKIDAVRANVEGLVPDKSGFSLTTFGFRRAWLSA